MSCEITLIINYEQNYDFKGCESDTGSIEIVSKGIKEQFEKFTIQGINTSSHRISKTIDIHVEEIYQDGKINPSKLFAYVAKVLKKTLCPKCL